MMSFTCCRTRTTSPPSSGLCHPHAPPPRPLTQHRYIPGAGTCNGQNPSFRIYDVDAVTGNIIDFFHYRPNLAAQGLINNNATDAPAPVWELVYSAQSAYNLTSLDAASWMGAAKQMRTDDDLFEFYLVNYYGGLSTGVYTPEERVQLLCEIIGGGTPAGVAKCTSSNMP